MITIIGATGFTGRLVTENLNSIDTPLRLCGRDRAKLENLTAASKYVRELVTVDVNSKQAVQKALANSTVVINCAGPFTELGLSVLEESISKGIHYLDITGEQQFIAMAINKFGEQARRNNVTAISACAFEYALADAAADLMESELGDLQSFESTYVIEGMYTSRGTKRSVLSALGSAAHQLRAGKPEKLNSGDIAKFVAGDGTEHLRFAFPGGEVYLLPLHSRVQNISTYLTSQAPYPILYALAGLGPIIAKTPLRSLIGSAINLSTASPERTQTRFCLSCRGTSAAATLTVNIEGADPYFLTAKIAAAFALELSRDAELPRGVISAAMMKGGGFVREIMLRESVKWPIENR